MNENSPIVYLKSALSDLYCLKDKYHELAIFAPLWLRICMRIIENHILDFENNYLMELSENDEL